MQSIGFEMSFFGGVYRGRVRALGVVKRGVNVLVYEVRSAESTFLSKQVSVEWIPVDVSRGSSSGYNARVVRHEANFEYFRTSPTSPTSG